MKSLFSIIKGQKKCLFSLGKNTFRRLYFGIYTEDYKGNMDKIEFKMPKMGESITEGTIIEWHVKEGDFFEEGDVLLEVATDKVDNEVPAPASGKMVAHKFTNGDVVPIGKVIAILEISESGGTAKTAP